MSKIETIELDRHRAEMASAVTQLVEKFRAIFDWDVPDIDQAVADRLILVEIRAALAKVEANLLERPARPLP